MKRPVGARDTQLPIADELAEIILIRRDLSNCFLTLRYWSKTYNPNEEDPEKLNVGMSLFRDAITLFVACFDGGKNLHPLVVEDVYPGLPGIAEYFRWLRGLRNSYSAHRSGAYRQCCVGIFVDPDTGALGEIQPFFAVYRGPEKSHHDKLIRLISIAMEHADRLVARLTDQFRDEVSKIPRSDLRKLPLATLQTEGDISRKSRGDLNREKRRK